MIAVVDTFQSRPSRDHHRSSADHPDGLPGRLPFDKVDKEHSGRLTHEQFDSAWAEYKSNKSTN
jgi:hypothetical protein